MNCQNCNTIIENGYALCTACELRFAGTPPGSLTGISKQLLALTREIERLEGNPAQGMTTQEDPEDDDDDGEFRPEAI